VPVNPFLKIVLESAAGQGPGNENPQVQAPQAPDPVQLQAVAMNVATPPRSWQPAADSKAAEIVKPVIQTPNPAPVPEWTPVKIFESFGYLDGSILDFGGAEEHAFAKFDGQDADVLGRKWKTVVCGTLAEQAPATRVQALLALRGLLRRDGKALIALPVGQSVEEWEPVLSKVFSVKRLQVKGAVAWQATPTKEFSEQDQPEQPLLPAPVAPPTINLPPINLGPVVIKIPERQVQVVAPINFSVPEQAPPQVNIAAGAVKVDVHTPPTPPPQKKRVVMHKDPSGRMTGELEVVEDQPKAIPEFPTVEEILAPDPQS
jgi:hypothetical protein